MNKMTIMVIGASACLSLQAVELIEKNCRAEVTLLNDSPECFVSQESPAQEPAAMQEILISMLTDGYNDEIIIEIPKKHRWVNHNEAVDFPKLSPDDQGTRGLDWQFP